MARKNPCMEAVIMPETAPHTHMQADPTELTMEALQREMGTVQRELTMRQTMREKELAALQLLTETRLSSMDRATDLRLAAINSVPGLIAKAVDEQNRLMEEKFGGIGLQFKERDTRTTQAAETSQKALDAALLAAAALVNQQNEANATAATVQTLSFTKQIDQIIVLTERQQKSSDDRLAELKERIDRGDGSSAGVQGARVEQRAGSTLVIAVVSSFLLALSLGVGLAALFLGR